MTTEQQLIILLSNPCLNKQENNTMQQLVQMKLDWNMISAQLMRHKIEAIAYYHFKSNQLCNAIPISLYKQIKGRYEKNKMMQTLYWNECLPIMQSFLRSKIKFCVLKGAALQEILYPPATRIYSDIDILIDRNDYEYVWEILNSYGFHNNQDLNQIQNKRERLFLLLNTYEFPEFTKKMPGSMHHFHLDIQHTHTLAKKLGYQISTTEDIENSKHMEIDGQVVPRQDLKYLLIHLCTHAFGDCCTISEIILHKAFRLRNFGDIIGLIEKHYNVFQSDEFFDLVIKTNTIKPVYYCMYYCSLIYSESDMIINLASRFEKQLENLSFLNQYGVENGTTGCIYEWQCDLDSRLFSNNCVDEVMQTAKADIQKYANYDTRINF